VFHGNGGYDFDTVYNMPIWLRNFTFKTIASYYEKENEKYNSTTPPPAPDKTSSVVRPTYTSKARN
jgi:hypothetical protein